MSAPASDGLLIVNADDFGLRSEVSDAIAIAWEARAITCATAMVFMEDSARAARIARRDGLALGLHLNLTTPLTDAPPDVAARQRRVVDYFARHGWRHQLRDPLAARAIAAAIGDQIGAFADIYGASVAHVDGHQHVQTCPTVFASRALAGVATMRAAHTYERGERIAPKRAVRAAINARIRRRFATTRWFWSLRDLEPRLGGSGLELHLDRARAQSAEIMVHPSFEDELAVLRSRAWLRALAEMPLGSHAALTGTSVKSMAVV